MAIGEGIRSTNQRRHDHVTAGRSVGFFTDPTVCIGCKACEVACKEWNLLPESGAAWSGYSYDNTGALGASTWRHVKFVERDGASGEAVAGLDVSGDTAPGASGPAPTDVADGEPGVRGRASGDVGGGGPDAGRDALTVRPAGGRPFRWLFLSDVCKHCEHAGCLEACPTGAIVRTEVGSVLVQDDVCNGCGYCVTGCPFGVIDRRPEPLPGAGGAFKCTFCYDRQAAGYTPACAKVCPTESIRFGPLDEMRDRAAIRVRELRERGHDEVRVYDPVETSVGGIHALFLLPASPEVFGLPERPRVPTVHLRAAWSSAVLTALASMAFVAGAFGLL